MLSAACRSPTTRCALPCLPPRAGNSKQAFWGAACPISPDFVTSPFSTRCCVACSERKCNDNPQPLLLFPFGDCTPGFAAAGAVGGARHSLRHCFASQTLPQCRLLPFSEW